MWKGDSQSQKLLSDKGVQELCIGSPLTMTAFANMVSHFRQKYSKDVNDTIMTDIIGMVAATLPSDGNLLSELIGGKASIYKCLPLFCGTGYIPSAGLEQACFVVHSCRNGCVAYCNARAQETSCPVCGKQRQYSCKNCFQFDCVCPLKTKPDFAVFYFFPLTYRLR